MARRVLTQEEIAARKLTPVAAPRRVLAADEVQARGLTPVQPEAPAQKEPPQVGPGATFALRGAGTLPAGGLVTDVLATAALRDATQAGKKFPGLSRAIAGLVGRLPGGQYLPAPVADAGAVLTPQAQAELYRLGLTEGEVKDPGIPEKGLVDTYREVRDRRKEETENGSEQNPWWGRAGAATGTLASILAPLPSVRIGPLAPALLGARGSRVAGGIASGAATGGAYGALSGATEGDADLTRGDVAGVARDIVDRGFGGATVGGVVGGLTAAASPLAQSVKDFAIKQGRRVIGGDSDVAAATRKELSDEAVIRAIEEDLIKPFSTTTATYGRIDKAAEKLGDEYGAMLKRLEDLGVTGSRATALAATLMRRANEMKWSTLAGDTAPSIMAKEARNIARQGSGDSTLPLAAQEGMKRTAQKLGRFERIKNTPGEEAYQELGSHLRQGIEDSVSTAGAAAGAGSEVGDIASRFKPTKERLSDLLAARNVGERGASKALQKAPVGLKDYLLGATTGNPAAAALTALASSGVRNRLPSAATVGAYRMSEALRTGAASPELARIAILLGQPDATSLSDLLRKSKDNR